MDAVSVRCEGLVHIYRSAATEVVALRDVDLTVSHGQTVAILGPSGAGKSTLLWVLSGLLRPSAGRVWLGKRELGRLSLSQLDRLRAREVGVVLQNPARNLIAHGTARQNVAFAQRAARTPRRERRRWTDELLGTVGLDALAGRTAGRLSGGEQQRLAVAVALANRPRLVLADEPTSQLDRTSAQQVVNLLTSTARRVDATVVAVTHDPAVSRAFDRVVTIRDGRVGTEARDGREYVVVGRDGSVQLPIELQDVLPAGALAEVVRTSDGVRLRRVTARAEAETEMEAP